MGYEWAMAHKALLYGLCGLFLCPLGWWCLNGVLVIGEGGIFNGKRGVLREAFGRKSDGNKITETT